VSVVSTKAERTADLDTLITAEDAEARIERVRQHLSDAMADLVELFNGRAWITLGYDSWADLCAAQFNGVRISLPRDERAEVVQELSGAGMSTRAIGSALGVGKSTISDDLAGVRNRTPERDLDPGEVKTITGLDGKTYQPAQQPVVVKAHIISSEAPQPVVVKARIISEEEKAEDLEEERRERAFKWASDDSIACTTFSKYAHQMPLQKMRELWPIVAKRYPDQVEQLRAAARNADAIADELEAFLVGGDQ
jgi:hypothetical protein